MKIHEYQAKELLRAHGVPVAVSVPEPELESVDPPSVAAGSAFPQARSSMPVKSPWTR